MSVTRQVSRPSRCLKTPLDNYRASASPSFRASLCSTTIDSSLCSSERDMLFVLYSVPIFGRLNAVNQTRQAISRQRATEPHNAVLAPGNPTDSNYRFLCHIWSIQQYSVGRVLLGFGNTYLTMETASVSSRRGIAPSTLAVGAQSTTYWELFE
jgi:hypothetical protein